MPPPTISWTGSAADYEPNRTQLSPEFSLFPAHHPYEIRDKRAGERLVARINRWLQNRPIAQLFGAKLDRFHREYAPKPTYSVEIVPVHHLRVQWLDDGPGYWGELGPALQEIFDVMRDRFDLVPTLVRTRAGVERHYPGGGCHLHYGVGHLFSSGWKWYRLMEAFHCNLLVDYANRPWIRWLFKQWFADDNGLLTVGAVELGNSTVTDPITGLPSRDYIIEASIVGNHGIEPRFMPCSKSSYLTFEFRLFSMVANADEFRLIALFLHAWVSYLVKLTIPLRYTPLADYVGVQPTLTLQRFQAMGSEADSWGFCEAFLTELGLPAADYRCFYERNYLNRIRFGKMV